MKKLLLFLLFGFMGVQLSAQLSNSQVMKIKEDADDGKSLWTKLFEDAYSKKNMDELPALRKANEDFLNENISKLSRMYAEGDARELVVAVKNYLMIEKQFVRDVMMPAESLNPNDEEGYNNLNKKIADFTQKERSFEIDITNALRTSPEPMMAESQQADEPDEELTEEEIKKREAAKPRRKEKLPHELYEKGNKKKKKKQVDEYEEED